MILVIDNYDSFTYNLVQYLGELNPNIEVHRNDRLTLFDINQKSPSHIVISSGSGHPQRAGISVEAIQTFAGRIPILGVGLGIQALVVAFGGTVAPTPVITLGKTSEICHDGRSVFQGLEYRFRATRYHSLMVDRNYIPPVLEVSATTPDGIIMGLRHRQAICEGIQFHPESIMTLPGKVLIRNFLSLSTV
ncbi:MAG TPA: aminodeoxychorismate/anthranilate synthase component II [Acidobacteriota bacterium]|nr:aminodeoxychorismate/anthranilate synthase component II [Acidobacteriota bacterium]